MLIPHVKPGHYLLQCYVMLPVSHLPSGIRTTTLQTKDSSVQLFHKPELRSPLFQVHGPENDS